MTGAAEGRALQEPSLAVWGGDAAEEGALLQERLAVVLQLTQLNSRVLRAEGRQAGLEVHAARLARDDGRGSDGQLALDAVRAALADEAVARAQDEAAHAELSARLRALDARLAALHAAWRRGREDDRGDEGSGPAAGGRP